MLEELAALPIRLGLRAARTVIVPLVRVAERGLSLAGLTGQNEEPAAPAPGPAKEATREPERRPVPASRPEPAPEPAPPAAPPVETHISEEPVVVASVADEGAEDGAGAQLRVAEPWDGYGRMKANALIERLEEATPEEIAMVQLYEGMNRRRKTVLAAAERRLERASNPAARS